MSHYTPQNILVTGGAGFIGCNYVRTVLAKHPDVKIINLDKLTYAGSEKNLVEVKNNPRHVFIHGDIADRALIDTLLREHDIDTIVHFAAESHVDRSISGPALFIQTNIIGTFTLLEAARAYWLLEKKKSEAECRFHHVSTDEVYGTLTADDAPFTEQSPYQPNSPYSASKASSDHLVRAYFHTYHLPVVTTNCSNNYGPYQHMEKLIPTIIHACLNQKPIPIYNDGSNIRDWLYVEDHCEALDVVLRHGKSGETWNIGGNNEWSNLNVVKQIVSLMDERFPENAPHAKLIQFVKDRPGHDWRYAIDPSRMRDELHWQPKHDFASGIRATVEWYLSDCKMTGGLLCEPSK
ncbi:MAG TPA: dTDP-glucose 4,6-dehydratase [Gammaproteobacteria bacterium]|nr:dTDP-glucose 4,6-dehydratase [Gammaproteobacteria bacterium]